MSDAFLSRAWWRKVCFGLLSAMSGSRRSKSPQLPRDPERILVLAPVLHGDYLVMSPLLAGLTRARPRAEIGVVVTRVALELAQADPMVDKAILYEKLPAWPRSITRIIRFKADIVVLPKDHPAFTEGMLLVFSRAPFRVGLSHPRHNMLLTHPVGHSREDEHRSESFARLLEPFGLDPANVNRLLHIGRDPAAERRAEQFFRDAGRGGFWVTVNISAGSPTRRWSTESWTALVKQLKERHSDLRFLILGVPGDTAACQGIAASEADVFTVPTGTFLEAVALLARTRLLISPDTGIVHAAAARSVPSLVLYNSDRHVYTQFAPQSVPHRAIFAPPGRIVRDIPVADVLSKFVPLRSEIEA